jgi:hypothetical protein
MVLYFGSSAKLISTTLLYLPSRSDGSTLVFPILPCALYDQGLVLGIGPSMRPEKHRFSASDTFGTSTSLCGYYMPSQALRSSEKSRNASEYLIVIIHEIITDIMK